MTLIFTWIKNKEVINIDLHNAVHMSYYEGSSVPNKSELADETFPYLSNPILTSYIVNEEKV